MAKLIKDFGIATCIEAAPANEEAALEWSSWRQDFVGLEGWLSLRESERKNPGGHFLYFFGGSESEKDWWLRTSYGDYELCGNKLTFITKNSRYVFALKEDE